MKRPDVIANHIVGQQERKHDFLLCRVNLRVVFVSKLNLESLYPRNTASELREYSCLVVENFIGFLFLELVDGAAESVGLVENCE